MSTDQLWAYLLNNTSYQYENLQLKRPRDHATPTQKTPIPGKPSKSGLIGVWHKNNLYLGTRTIGNGNPNPTNIDSRTRSIRMMSRSQLFFDKSFFSSLESQGRELSHQHTTSTAKEVLIWKLRHLMIRTYKCIFIKVLYHHFALEVSITP